MTKPLDARIAYYTRKVAEYGAAHPNKEPNPYRFERLIAYKKELDRRIKLQKNNPRQQT